MHVLYLLSWQRSWKEIFSFRIESSTRIERQTDPLLLSWWRFSFREDLLSFLLSSLIERKSSCVSLVFLLFVFSCEYHWRDLQKRHPCLRGVRITTTCLRSSSCMRNLLGYDLLSIYPSFGVRTRVSVLWVITSSHHKLLCLPVFFFYQ
jgi:hypothetical protein